MDDKRTITAKFASDTTGIATSLPDKKLITYLEMQGMMPEVSSWPITMPEVGQVKILNLTGTQSDKLRVVFDYNDVHYIGKNVETFDISIFNKQNVSTQVVTSMKTDLSIAILMSYPDPVSGAPYWAKTVYSNEKSNNNVLMRTLKISQAHLILVSYENTNNLNPEYN